MLSIARALALDSSLFLLDEPFEGLSPAIVPGIRNSMHEIVRLGGTVLIAEVGAAARTGLCRPHLRHRAWRNCLRGHLDQARRDPTVHRIIGDML